MRKNYITKSKVRRLRFSTMKKRCRFCADKNLKINYLNTELLRRFTTERGKILSSRISGNCARHQRRIAKAIKKARCAGIMAFIAE